MGLNYDFDYDDDCQESRTYTTVRKAAKIANDPTKHYPNKDEAQALRKIMSSTGLSEEEVRADKKYRIELSEAQKLGQKPKRTETERTFQRLIKHACKKTGLVPEHPETLKALQEILDKDALSYFRRSWLERNKLTAENVVKNYRRK
jgi:hypothetical protein